MGRTEMYTEFLRTGSSMRLQPVEAGGVPIEVEYAIFTCPHCAAPFEMPSASVKKLKSSRCLKHLQECPKHGGGKKPKAPTMSDMMMELKGQREEIQKLRAENKESMARISQAFGLGDPDAQTENELVVRGKRKIDEARGNVFHTLPKTDEALKQYRVFLSSDKDADIEKKYSPAVNELRAAMLEQLLESDKRRRA